MATRQLPSVSFNGTVKRADRERLKLHGRQITTRIQLKTTSHWALEAQLAAKLQSSWAGCLLYIQVAQLSRTDRAARWVSYGKKWKTGTGRQYLRTL